MQSSVILVARVFTQFSRFPICTSVDITVFHNGKCFIFFYNTAKRNIKWKICEMSLTLSQSASTIYKCCIINEYM